uniref:Uncharacterized protein n=1 Tax=Oryza meridionalis TaxID=40149 RepID=A0A0E0D0L6_9ORYZ
MGSNEPSLLVIPEIPLTLATACCILCTLAFSHAMVAYVQLNIEASHDTKVVSTLKYEADEADKKGLHLLGEEE